MEEVILSALKDRPKTNKEIRASVGLSLEEYDSKLDRTLQKLRKGGKIQLLTGGRWALATFQICEHCNGKGWK